MADGAGSWCLIESDPGVFTELIKEFGVKGLQVEELWSLEPESFKRLGTTHGLIFLFKWIGIENEAVSSQSIVQDSRLDNIFFAKQVIQNACATQAIISILMNLNNESSEIEVGTVLSDFKEFTKCFDPTMRGLALSNSDTIRTVHNSFARQSVFEFDESKSKQDKNEDVFHFIGYVPIDGRLYELDGLKDGPVDLGAIPANEDWTSIVTPILQQRISRYGESEIHFSLLAVVGDRKLEYEKKLNQIMNSGVPDENKNKIAELKRLIHEEEVKRQKFKIENIRRKHNYLPLIIQFLKELAENKMLISPFYEKAKERDKAAAAKNNKSGNGGGGGGK